MLVNGYGVKFKKRPEPLSSVDKAALNSGRGLGRGGVLKIHPTLAFPFAGGGKKQQMLLKTDFSWYDGDEIKDLSFRA